MPTESSQRYIAHASEAQNHLSLHEGEEKAVAKSPHQDCFGFSAAEDFIASRAGKPQ